MGSEVRVTGKGSSRMVIAVRVEVFFNVDGFGFLMVMFIVSTFVLKGVIRGQETADKDKGG